MRKPVDLFFPPPLPPPCATGKFWRTPPPIAVRGRAQRHLFIVIRVARRAPWAAAISQPMMGFMGVQGWNVHNVQTVEPLRKSQGSGCPSVCLSVALTKDTHTRLATLAERVEVRLPVCYWTPAPAPPGRGHAVLLQVSYRGQPGDVVSMSHKKKAARRRPSSCHAPGPP